MRYYSTQRPVMPGSFPKEGAQEIHNFDSRTFIPEIGREAWGYIEYSRTLTPQEAASYELMSGEVKTWYAVMVTVWDEDSAMQGARQAAIMQECRQVTQPKGWERRAKNRSLACTWYDSLKAAEAAVSEAVA